MVLEIAVSSFFLVQLSTAYSQRSNDHNSTMAAFCIGVEPSVYNHISESSKEPMGSSYASTVFPKGRQLVNTLQSVHLKAW
jgi:hypothetical protein